MKVLVACGNGMGTSQIMKMKAKSVFKKLDIDVKIDHMSLGEAKSRAQSYDVVFCSESLVSNFSDKCTVVGLKNMLSEEEMETRLKEKVDI